MEAYECHNIKQFNLLVFVSFTHWPKIKPTCSVLQHACMLELSKCVKCRESLTPTAICKFDNK